MRSLLVRALERGEQHRSSSVFRVQETQHPPDLAGSEESAAHTRLVGL